MYAPLQFVYTALGMQPATRKSSKVLVNSFDAATDARKRTVVHMLHSRRHAPVPVEPVEINTAAEVAAHYLARWVQ